MFRGAQLLQQQSHSISYASAGAISLIWTKSSWYGWPGLVGKWTVFISRYHFYCIVQSTPSTVIIRVWQPQSRAPATVDAPSWLCIMCLLSNHLFLVNVSPAPVHFDLQHSSFCSRRHWMWLSSFSRLYVLLEKAFCGLNLVSVISDQFEQTSTFSTKVLYA